MNNFDNNENNTHLNPLENMGVESGLTVNEQARREALRKIGAFSAYAAPVMMAVFSKKAAAGS